jgi:DNA-binding response OmpR family regulator
MQEPVMSADSVECANRRFDSRPLADKAFLVVEDEGLIAMNVESWLQEAGASRVETAHRLSAAHALLDKNAPFDAAIVDFRLADGDANSLIAWLGEHNIPIVVTTGDPSALRGRESPMIVLLEKPYSEETFLTSIAALLAVAKRGSPCG